MKNQTDREMENAPMETRSPWYCAVMLALFCVVYPFTWGPRDLLTWVKGKVRR